MQIKIPIPYSLTETDFENIDNSLAYIDNDVINYSIDKDGNIIVLEFKTKEKEKHLIQEIECLLKKLKPVTDEEMTVFLFDNTQAPISCSDNIFLQLVGRGDVIPHQPGYFSITGDFLKMLKVLDKKILEFATKQGAKEIDDPITISLTTLNESDFFKRTPQFAYFMSTLSENSQNISEFSKLVEEDTETLNFNQYLNRPNCMCRSAVCYNSYPSNKNKIFKKGESLCFTTKGKVFRNESKKVSGLERMYEFTVRDIIYYGDASYVKDRLQECVEWYSDILNKFKLNGSIQSASDPFFADHLQKLQFYQMAEQSKFEIRLLNLFSKNKISIGSINNHGSHFSKSYNIKFEEGNFVTTGCVGFGFERFIFMILSQHGLDKVKWPKELIDFFANE